MRRGLCSESSCGDTELRRLRLRSNNPLRCLRRGKEQLDWAFVRVAPYSLADLRKFSCAEWLRVCSLLKLRGGNIAGLDIASFCLATIAYPPRGKFQRLCLRYSTCWVEVRACGNKSDLQGTRVIWRMPATLWRRPTSRARLCPNVNSQDAVLSNRNSVVFVSRHADESRRGVS